MVKRDNMIMVQKLRQHEDKIAKLENMIEYPQPMKVYRKSRPG